MTVLEFRSTHRTRPGPGAIARFLSVVLVIGVISGACGSATVTQSAAATAANNPSGVVASTAPSTPTAAPTASCKQGGIVTVAFQDPVATLAPGTDDVGNGELYVTIPLYDTLVALLPGHKDPQPDLATSWDISSDSLTYTFHLRSGVKFSNGDPVTADDIVFAMNQMMDPKIDLNWQFMVSNVKSFEIVDPATIRMNMSSADGSILWTLAHPAFGIYPKKVMQQLGYAAFGQKPVGSGPFMFSSWTPDQSIKLVKNPYYWGKTSLDGITFDLISDPTARVLAIESGAVDIASNIAYNQIAEVTSHADISVPLDKLMIAWQVTLNNKSKPLDEKVVRQALNYATPKDVINKLVLAGVGTPSNSMMAQGGQFWDPSIPAYPYDLDKAKALMAQSSVPNGFSLDVMIKDHTEVAATAAILQAEWAKIGVKLTITPVSDSVHWDRMLKDDFQAQMEDPWAYTSDIPDDNEHAQIFFTDDPSFKSWFSQYDSAETTALVKAADGTTDNAKRQSLYSQLQTRMMDESPVVSLLQVPNTNANSTKLLGANVTITGWWRFDTMCFKA